MEMCKTHMDSNNMRERAYLGVVGGGAAADVGDVVACAQVGRAHGRVRAH